MRTQTVFTVALTHIALACAAQALHAATPEGSPTGAAASHVTALKPLSATDADYMLREARAAIEKGNLEEADKIVSRVESAHVKFSVFHVGPDQASVRRELTRAQKAAQAGNKAGSKADSTAAKSHLPFARSAAVQAKPAADPFIGHNHAAEKSATPATPGRGLSGVSAPTALPADNTPATKAAAYNQPADADVTTADRANSLAGLKYPVTPASNEANPFQTGAGASNATPAADPYASRSQPVDPLALSATTERTAPLTSPASPGLMPPSRGGSSYAASDAQARDLHPKQQAQADLAAARKALEAGDIARAEQLTKSATALGVPESEFLPDEDRPSLVTWDIARAKQKGQSSQPAVARLPAVAPSRYDMPAEAQANAVLPPAAQNADAKQSPVLLTPPTSSRASSRAATAPESNRVSSLPSADSPAMQQATPGPRVLPPATLNGPGPQSLRMAQATAAPPSEDLPQPGDNAPGAEFNNVPMSEPVAPARGKASLMDSADDNMRALAQKLDAEVGKRQTEAMKLQEKDPERAVTILHEAQQLVKDSKLPESSQRALLSRIEITLARAEKFTNDHKSELDLDRQNAAVKADVDRDRELKLKMQQKISEQIDEFNRLKDEQRYAEAEIVARRLNEIAPDDPVVAQVWLMAKFLRREMMNRQLVDNKEQSVWNQLNAVEESAINPVAVDGQEVAYDKKHWTDFVQNRKGSKDRVQRHTEREMEIERRLKTGVLLKYQDTPLSEVMSGLSELTGVNIHLDQRGLSQEGVNSDTLVTINLAKEVQLKSALNLILEPLHLTFVINDEVLKITSEQLRDGQIYPYTYNVADLVTPIPNFVPSNNIGLQGLINEATSSASNGRIGIGQQGPTALVSGRGRNDAAANGDVLAQQFNAAPGGMSSSNTVPIGAGPGGMGAGANADFDSLIDLIVSTVSTDTWAENGGGQAEIRPFPTNLSLVISQTQAVHEEIADLLQQLRRLQDLQVTIEVRFIRLNDSFFERIGIDFQADIDDSGVNQNNRNQFQPDNATGHSNTVGLQNPAGTNTFPNFTTDLDIPFRQNSFGLTQIVPFGGPVGGGANFGFAILSDIEAYFLIEAAQGDRRTNVLNAPKVTLFNGQQAFVADATQRPFVVGVIPVVGEFAAAQQPVIVVLNEGTMMTIQAVVSEDRRYVRMTIVPFFTQIGDVDTFTFEGSSSTTSSSSTTDDNTDGKNESKEDSSSGSNTGVTVQLPSFSFVSVVTTVSVPDGGTVLLGGIKRLSEGRSEFGVPLLSKVPYINRLFKNVAIGRETDSLMMMVTPRIIIQEEEEERLGLPPTP